jgi:hypothetical protein
MDDRPTYERLAAWWRGMGRRRQALVAGSMALVTAGGLAGGRLLFRDEGEQPTQLRPDKGTAAGVAPGGQAAAADTSEAPKWVWEADCTDVDHRYLGNGMFVLSPQFVQRRGTANPSQTYTVVSRPTEGEATEVVSAVRWDSPDWVNSRSITINLTKAYGVVAIAAVTFPDPNHQPQHGSVPAELGNEFPEAVVNACAPAFPNRDGNPTALVDALGDPY